MTTESRQMLVHLMIQGEDKGPFTTSQTHQMLKSRLITHDTMSKIAHEWVSLLPLMTRPNQTPPLASKWIIKVREEEKGPFSFSQLQGMWNSGAITADTVVSQEEQWQPLYSALASMGGASVNVKKHDSDGEAIRSTTAQAAERPPVVVGSACGLEPEIRSTALSVGAWIGMVGLLFMPVVSVVCGICVLRGWCKRRTLKVLRKRSWKTESFVRSVWVPAFFGFAWRSFLAFTAIGFAFGIGARLDEMAQISIVLVIWLLGVILSIDVPYWIKKRLERLGCKIDDSVATMKTTDNTRTKIVIVALCATAAAVIVGFIMHGTRPSVPKDPPTTEAEMKEFMGLIAEAKELERTGFLGTFKTADRQVKLELRMQRHSGQPKEATLTGGEGADAVIVEGTWFIKDPSHVVIQLKGGDPFLYELQKTGGQIELRGMGLIFYRQ